MERSIHHATVLLSTSSFFEDQIWWICERCWAGKGKRANLERLMRTGTSLCLHQESYNRHVETSNEIADWSDERRIPLLVNTFAISSPSNAQGQYRRPRSIGLPFDHVATQGKETYLLI